MTTAENKQLLQDIFAASARGDSRPLVENMAEDFRWTIAGNGRWSRTYDKQAVLTELFPALRARQTSCRTSFQFRRAQGERRIDRLRNRIG